VARRRSIAPLPFVQLVAEGRTAARPTLPSALYLAGAHDLPAGTLALPWREDEREVVGELAQALGARIPGRLVTSAKSWLAHGAVDRTAAILPWGAPDEVTRVSPVAASGRFLAHLRAVWDAAHPTDPLAAQEVVLTVPASFDEVARELTVAAAHAAGLTELTLLEEPQAAFYAWLAGHERDWPRVLADARRVLVIDVGGGTTDFTLIDVHADDDPPALERVAVGDHLLLGGDNMDMALARHVEAQVGDRAGKLDSVRWQGLVLQCRLAKERLLAGGTSATVRLPGRGRAIVAETVSVEVGRDDVERLVLDGFFPMVDAASRPRPSAGAGLREWGLPFTSDSEIPRHLAAFLARHDVTLRSQDAVLFNGGVFTPAALRERMTAVLAAWSGDAPVVLHSAGLQDAVARGAAYYGLVRRGRGVRVSAGSARACYLGLGPADDPADERLLCVQGRGMEEGEVVRVEEPEFEVLANQPVSFQLYTSSSRSGETPGALVEASRASLAALPPIRTVLRHGKKLAATSIPVHVESHRTAVGTLELWCAAKDSQHRWRLEFQLRAAPLLAGEPVAEDPGAELEIRPAQVEAAVAAVRAVFPAAAARTAVVAEPDAPVRLVRDLESTLGAGKDAWSLPVIRTLWDAMWEGAEQRAPTPAHEARWLNLCGFCLRPGFGDDLDAWRMRQLGRVLGGGLAFPRAVQGRAEWWNLWKRIAGGLERGAQLRLHGELGRWLVPRLQRKAKVKVSASERPTTQEIREMWQAVGACERLDVTLKAELGAAVVADVERRKAVAQQLWALARLGGREPLYGPLNCVVSADVVGGWIERLLALPAWSLPEATTFAVVQLARVVDDRARDLDAALRERLAARLATLPGGERGVRMLHEPVPLDRAEQGRLLDESLPAGLRVRAPS
jgi:hypothetical protein